MEGFIIILAAIGVYLIPTVIAVQEKKANRNSIIALNILAGWTIAGWIGALIWALAKDREA